MLIYFIDPPVETQVRLIGKSASNLILTIGKEQIELGLQGIGVVEPPGPSTKI